MGGCQFVTPDMQPALAMEYMRQHRADEHSQQPVQQTQAKPVHTAQPAQHKEVILSL